MWYKIILFFCIVSHTAAQNATVTGKVSFNSQPVANVTIYLTQASKSYTLYSDNLGVFKAELPLGKYALHVRSLGLITAKKHYT
jgi:hypothetical protein